HRRLDRPDVLLQPGLEREVIGDAAHQRHRVVGVGIDEARHQHAVGTRHHLGRGEARACLGAWQQRDDRAVAHGHGMVLEHHAVRLNRDDMPGLDQQVAGFGHHLVFHHHLTRLTYSPERVSTLTISSWLTNSGTRTTAPVSSVAGLPPPPEVSPRTPGSVSVIFSSTKFGGVTWMGVPFHRVTTQSSSPLSHFSAPPMPALSAWTCSKFSGSMKCQYSPSA